jgi:hypothetical protein
MGKKPGSGTATNNSFKYFALKVALRLNSLPNRDVSILECFAGEGKIWKKVQSKFPYKIKITKIDINEYQGVNNIKADSLRLINKIDIAKFDIIDLDSWGSPIDHLEVIFNKEFSGIIHCTYCCPIPLNPHKKLADLYYKIPREKIKEKPSIFAKDLNSMVLKYLNLKGISKINGFLSQKNSYFYFHLDNSLKFSNLNP